MGLRRIEQIIILRMIYAYCLSLFSIHFFGSHSIASFKLRLINQQTGDCTDSAILNAGKLTPSTFPVPIKLKGGQRLLVKVKLLSLPSKSAEVLIGEGVVTFDKNSIDNTLRVPIYDKQRGVEEVAICSIDFFLSGFEVDKHQSINQDKSRSRFQDWRERTEDAVYSQMSYTLESERQSNNSQDESNVPKPNLATAATANTKDKKSLPEVKPRNKDEKLKPQNQKRKDYKPQPPEKQPQPNSMDHEEEEQILAKKNFGNFSAVKPFTLENNVYLEQSPQKMPLSGKKALKQTKKKPSSHLRKKFAIESEEDLARIQKDHSPDNLRKTVKDNEEILLKLKQYLTNIQKEESPKHKRRRNMIKIEEFASYKSQNNYVKYYVDLKPPPSKVIKNLKAIRIIENQIKQPNQDRIIPQKIDHVVLYSLSGVKLVTFDASGFRSYCLSTEQSEQVASIMIPTLENAVKVQVGLGQQGKFEGVIGFQEGNSMNINLTRLNASEESILERSEFKLLFDIKSTDPKPSARNIHNYHNNQISFRQPYELIASPHDIKSRVSQFSGQPWGFVKSYAEEVIPSAQSKRAMDKINQQLPQLKIQQNRLKVNSQQKSVSENNAATKRHQENILNSLQSPKPRSLSREYLDTPIKKLKPIPLQIRREADSINSIRNGNRNNYRFQERTSSKQIKQAWEELLFKRKIDEQRAKQSEKQIKPSINTKQSNYGRPRHYSEGKRKINQLNTDSDSDSLSTFKPRKSNKIYEFAEDKQQRPAYPLRTFTLRITNISITQPQAIVDQSSRLNLGKFVKFSIKERSIYFTEVIFSGSYNSILWKLEGCTFQQLRGTQRLKIQIYQTFNNRITTLGVVHIRVNRLYFLRGSHIYNGTMAHQSSLNGEFTLGFEIDQNYPFEVIREEDEDTINLASHPPTLQRSKLQNHQSQKYMKNLSNKNMEISEESMMDGNEMEESMSMPLGLTQT